MKRTILVGLSLLSSWGIIGMTADRVPASPFQLLPEVATAALPPIRLPMLNHPWAIAQDFTGFSGKYTEYKDSYNGFKLNIPVEFTLHERGATTDWLGPLLDGGSALIYINATPMKGVSSKVIYDANLRSKQEDRNVMAVVPLKVKFGKQTVWAFRYKEANHKPGSPEPKEPGDIHRWHLLVFGNETVYTLGFTGPFQSFQDNKLQVVYEAVIQSVELIPITQ
ncbi:hypothetical protein DO97_13855 [Neosynechococcus sphagnicola sy1]|uniref:Uncharacterized protein n=1 Tax=Neosynechococcus sphagnicola sy1 TaxID=1497020 RepID=A0A098TIW4_9CYAN|nr:hypothetical protein [Neosynechococcus sphagnicola]KGF71981.1 hypothetical protein DO97_13855 [Neosynechococcus sphagnicola sy1]